MVDDDKFFFDVLILDDIVYFAWVDTCIYGVLEELGKHHGSSRQIAVT